MADIDYAARVQRGIALMDEKWPEWATEIDLDRLDIQSGTNCMTAQYAEQRGRGAWYATGQLLLELNQDEYDMHGFDIDNASLTNASDESGYAALNGLWKAEIERRRAQGQDAPAEPESGT